MKRSKGTLFTYTTTIDPEKTIAEIEQMLSAHGAESIMKNYDGGNVVSLSFAITVNRKKIGFTLPCSTEPVFIVLKQQYEQGKIQRTYCNSEQAARVAWRIIHYWVKAQMAILETKMVKMEQIFLPYIVTGNGRTLFDDMQNNSFKLLGKEE